MQDSQNNQARNRFAASLGRLLGHSISGACGTQWQIELADPPSAIPPSLVSPVPYRLQFGQGLEGVCYLVFSQADALAFSGQGSGSGDKQAEGAALLKLVRAVLTDLQRELAPTRGEITLEADLAASLDPLAVQTLELRARDANGSTTAILLYLDPQLVRSLAMAADRSALSGEEGTDQANLALVMDVELNVTLRFGQRQLTLREILDLASGSVVELDRQVDEPVELILDGKVIARGEAVIIDGNYGLRVTQVLHPVAF